MPKMEMMPLGTTTFSGAGRKLVALTTPPSPIVGAYRRSISAPNTVDTVASHRAGPKAHTRMREQLLLF